ncbi:helix-turn-helix domain-containing protein, partial [Klebsiella aerogenes]|uniref:helix-turn-helix domain-containing protein n=1 Tax=Klebsiella aerogenes TaxID=548 RepID=UPI001BCAED54
HNLDSLAEVVAMSRRTLTRHFARATGMSIANWLTAERLRRSQSRLGAGGFPVEQAAATVGPLSPLTRRPHFQARFGPRPPRGPGPFPRGGLGGGGGLCGT